MVAATMVFKKDIVTIDHTVCYFSQMESETSEAPENIKAGLGTYDFTSCGCIQDSPQRLGPHYATRQTYKKRKFPPAEDLLPKDIKAANEARGMNMVIFPKYFSLTSFPFQCF